MNDTGRRYGAVKIITELGYFAYDGTFYGTFWPKASQDRTQATNSLHHNLPLGQR